MQSAAFCFFDVPRMFTLVDREIELVEPDVRYVDELLAACGHPLTQQFFPAQAKTDRQSVMTFLKQNPRGRAAGDPGKSIAPGYTFWMRVRPEAFNNGSASAAGHGSRLPGVTIAGSISLRIGHSLNLDRYLGHIGYHVYPPARGFHFAERATRMLLAVARAHGHRTLWITCNPENLASRRTCERLPARFVDTVSVPVDNPLYTQGDRQKCRYRVDL